MEVHLVMSHYRINELLRKITHEAIVSIGVSLVDISARDG
jgi:hypothetical protein